MMRLFRLAVSVAASLVWLGHAHAQNSSEQVPPAIAAPGKTVAVSVHAEGAQIYECKPDSSGKLTWQFREPIATLLLNGKTVGRHYAGPTWEMTDGSLVVAKTAGSAPGATAGDIAWLKLDVVKHGGDGQLSDLTTVQRINTHGGAAQGACDQSGGFRSVPYSAEYRFLK